MADSERIALKIGGQEFVLLAKPEERGDVMEAAKRVEEQMKELGRRGASGIPKQAVMAAFDLMFDQVRLSRDPLVDPKTRADLERRLDNLIQTVDKALGAKT